MMQRGGREDKEELLGGVVVSEREGVGEKEKVRVYS